VYQAPTHSVGGNGKRNAVESTESRECETETRSGDSTREGGRVKKTKSLKISSNRQGRQKQNEHKKQNTSWYQDTNPWKRVGILKEQREQEGREIQQTNATINEKGIRVYFPVVWCVVVCLVGVGRGLVMGGWWVRVVVCLGGGWWVLWCKQSKAKKTTTTTRPVTRTNIILQTKKKVTLWGFVARELDTEAV